MFLLILFPLVILIFQCIILYRNSSDLFFTYLSWRKSIITSILFYSLWVVISTECLSLFNAITFNGIFISYLVYLSLLLYIILKKSLWKLKIDFSIKKLNLSFLEKSIIIFYILLFSYLLFAAIACPPNNWDSMTYHLPRVMHWIQNKNVNYYPTHHEFQNIFPPLAEYVILHWQILTGDDYFSQAVQFMYMIGSCLVITLIVKEIYNNRLAQLCCFFLAATLPLGMYESVSTQNDYVNSFFIVCSVYFLFQIIKSNSLIFYFLFIISVSLAIKTKSTSYIFLALPCLICVIILFKKQKRILLTGFCMIIMFTIVNAGTYYRNWKMYHNLLGVSVNEYKPSNNYYTWKPVYSNLLKYTGYQLQSGQNDLDHFFLNVVNGFHRVLDIDIADPDISVTKIYLVPVGETLFNEDYVSNPVQSILIIISFIIILLNVKSFNKEMLILLAIITTGMVLFSLYLKWWEFNNRLILPLLLLSTAISGICITLFFSRVSLTYFREAFFFIFLVSLGIYSIDKIINCRNIAIFTTKNIFNSTRNELYFHGRENLRKSYFDAIEQLKTIPCKKIGLINGIDDWEYPLWILAKKNIKDIRIESLNVKNPSKKNNFKPCITIKLDNAKAKVEIKAF